ncbi:MAG: haloacid dehalogenase-like hydrolase [Oscillospiraceae bacterium]|nr:haloacid dehalogenase-like hydrolase [Oscillospiraceae bacterium]
MNVYDFDNTIYDGESSISFFLFYICRHPAFLNALPVVLRALCEYKKGGMSAEDILKRYAPLIEGYFTRIKGDPVKEIEKFWDSHMRKIKPFYYSLQKDDDLVLSALPEQSLKVVCERLNIKHYIGTVIDMKTGRIEKLCFHSRKPERFFEKFPDAVIENFYTDSEIYDGPLIEAAKRAFLVKKNMVVQIK